MFRRIRSKLDDMGTLERLAERAEAHALQDQQREPGAEHFLLAALDLPDGTARLSFGQMGVNPDALKDAIERQYGDALRSVGVTADASAVAPLQAKPGVYRAAASGQAVMRELAATRKGHGPLLGAHVVAIVAGMRHGVAARALRALAIDADALRSTAEAIAKGLPIDGAPDGSPS